MNLTARPHLLVRADAGPQIGIGHVMRCLALVEAWQERGGRATLLSSRLPEAIAERLRAADVGCVELPAPAGTEADAAATVEAAEATATEWLVVDGYQFDAAYQAQVKQGSSRVLWIDDCAHAAPYCADLVVNQNLGATAAAYGKIGAATRVLAGGNYAMLRREFRSRRPSPRQPKMERVLVTFGGSDPGNVTGSVLQAADKALPDTARLRAVMGAANPNLEAVQNMLPALDHAVELVVSPKEIAPLMDWADLAITAAGSTCWELLCLGVPLIAISIAENQQPVAQALASHGAGIDVGWHTDAGRRLGDTIRELARSPEKLAAMSRVGSRLIDGRGALRVLAAMRGEMEMRPARMDDACLLWKWANDPVVREASFVGDTIEWEHHLQWLKERLADPRCLLLLVEERGIAIGQIRYDVARNREAEIDVSVSPELRGRGYGRRMIQEGAAYLFATTDTQVLHALIKRENHASMRAFAAAGFRFIGEIQVRGHSAVQYSLQRESESSSATS